MGGSKSNSKTPIKKRKTDTSGQPRANLTQHSFESLVQNHGYSVYLDRSVLCPCKLKDKGGNQSSCRNCGGVGIVYTDRIETQVVLQSMNIDNEQKEWSEELTGTVRITAKDSERLSVDDRIVVRDLLFTYNQVLYPSIASDGKLVGRSAYGIKNVESVYLFVDGDTALTRLEIDTDYTIKDQHIILDSKFDIGSQISLRYEYNPEYIILDLPRAGISAPEPNKLHNGTYEPKSFPNLAVGRLSHFVVDQDSYSNDWLIDNSSQGVCPQEV